MRARSTLDWFQSNSGFCQQLKRTLLCVMKTHKSLQ